MWDSGGGDDDIVLVLVLVLVIEVMVEVIDVICDKNISESKIQV